ncbi:FMN-dependent NADH-azoreductase [Ursidibacter maritimus]|uniref:FMN dependent NADH:quinone oxidoreductase n=1 Tax=Ursidibacter maritimus TaxID=1331689 RepID=A0A949T3T3_9PAST|nr:FMN-dependent NADH-azoreductase [Ursidibacter maritimus]KAE9540114.1 FMN-dependent NADH-azoreductase [Ursidibacter maritimus]MBV6524375.1 FMN-dependent NADH-azoreductase [Ursidibacter maritimus]MBV6526559.1 FMN-dependent NADH-azoreductase [Ursidibacter maritimus]MBV6527806.1 FMN-dependent NADH-azoreductase [Ursidibacter maritimus]MBV6530127.1 FMN-dependent NADH-azoreductase [Ursidibacter maritimus]
MKKVLVLKSSILAEHSQSNLLSDYFIQQLNAEITTRDLVKQPLPYFTSDAAAATRGEPATEEQKKLLALSNELVAEIKNSDVIVINAPMYNFSVPAQLKSYFDYIARSGVTFQYTAEGPEGLVKGKKAIVILTTGGLHKDKSTDLVKVYVQTFLGFIGITDVEFVYAEALGFGPEAVEKAQQSAKAELDRLAKEL